MCNSVERMDFHTEAWRIVNELKRLVPKSRNSRERLKREAVFWSSLYQIRCDNEKIRKELEVIIEMELDALRIVFKNIL